MPDLHHYFDFSLILHRMSSPFRYYILVRPVRRVTSSILFLLPKGPHYIMCSIKFKTPGCSTCHLDPRSRPHYIACCTDLRSTPHYIIRRTDFQSSQLHYLDHPKRWHQLGFTPIIDSKSPYYITCSANLGLPSPTFDTMRRHYVKL